MKKLLLIIILFTLTGCLTGSGQPKKNTTPRENTKQFSSNLVRSEIDNVVKSANKYLANKTKSNKQEMYILIDQMINYVDGQNASSPIFGLTVSRDPASIAINLLRNTKMSAVLVGECNHEKVKNLQPKVLLRSEIKNYDSNIYSSHNGWNAFAEGSSFDVGMDQSSGVDVDRFEVTVFIESCSNKVGFFETTIVAEVDSLTSNKSIYFMPKYVGGFYSDFTKTHSGLNHQKNVALKIAMSATIMKLFGLEEEEIWKILYNKINVTVFPNYEDNELLCVNTKFNLEPYFSEFKLVAETFNYKGESVNTYIINNLNHKDLDNMDICLDKTYVRIIEGGSLLISIVDIVTQKSIGSTMKSFNTL